MIKTGFNILLLLGLISLAAVTSNAGCIVSTTPVGFGTYLGTVTLGSTGSVTTVCTGLPAVTTVQVYMDAGQQLPANFAARKMKSQSGQRLSYNLYTDAAHTQIWGDGTPGTLIQQGLNLIIYGQMTAGQSPAPGNYTDSVLVTVVW
ncbi:spore coat protein U domain-containing protein [Mariprofundus ferrooxydans]|nr:spore coat protein U domain-containing protein [Mariprofundus ferrooxydans]